MQQRVDFFAIVFSTSVEVFPVCNVPTTADSGLLHVRGGVSASQQ